MRPLRPGKMLFIKLLSFLPRRLRYAAYREMIRVKLPPQNTVFKIAETEDEISQALTILHRAYVQEGLMDPHPSGMRVTLYHALPTTTILIAKRNDEVLGTLTMIRDNPIGLPGEGLMNLERLRNEGHQIAEVSALAIQPRYRGRLLFPLLKFMYTYSTKYLAIDTLLAVTTKQWSIFYESILFFKIFPVSSDSKGYTFVDYNTPVALSLNLKEAFSEFARYYGGRRFNRGLFHYFVVEDSPEFQFPAREFFRASDPVMTPKLLNLFFRKKTNLFEKLSPDELDVFRRLYPEKEFQRLFETRFPNKQRHSRRPVNCKGELHLGDEIIPILLINASLKGFCAISQGDPIQSGQVYSGKALIGEFTIVSFKVRSLWSKGVLNGFNILEVSEEWYEFVGENVVKAA
ncbi:hypothetical protein K2X30_14800 [bacterium]|nr:hypothetical protein [bacterium]